MRISDWSSDVCSSDLGAAEIDDDMAELDALDDAGDDLAGAVLEFLILPLALGVADLLEDDLLGGLGGDAAELDRRQRIDDEVADLGARLALLRSEEHTSELQSLMRISYAVSCLKKKKT